MENPWVDSDYYGSFYDDDDDKDCMDIAHKEQEARSVTIDKAVRLAISIKR